MSKNNAQFYKINNPISRVTSNSTNLKAPDIEKMHAKKSPAFKKNIEEQIKIDEYKKSHKNDNKIYATRDPSIDKTFNEYQELNYMFERETRRESINKNFDNNAEFFYSNIKNQIFAETQRLIKNDYEQVSISEDEIKPIERKYLTGEPTNDAIIGIVANKDPELLKLLDDETLDTIESFAESNRVETDYDKLFEEKQKIEMESLLTDKDREEITGITSYIDKNGNIAFREEEPRRSEIELDDETKEYIARYDEIHRAESPYNQLEREIKEKVRNNIHVETLYPQGHPVYISPADTAYAKKLEEERANSLEKDKEEEKQKLIEEILEEPVFKEKETITPIVPTVKEEDRITQVKDTNETEFERIKKFVRDFSQDLDFSVPTNEKVQINDALVVDLNDKFYLSPEELKEKEKLQSGIFNDVVREYEKVIETQKEKDLQEFYNQESKREIPARDNSEIVTKIKEQHNINKKVVEENIDLKRKINELEKQLQDPISLEKLEKPIKTDEIIEEEKKLQNIKNELEQIETSNKTKELELEKEKVEAEEKAKKIEEENKKSEAQNNPKNAPLKYDPQAFLQKKKEIETENKTESKPYSAPKKPIVPTIKLSNFATSGGKSTTKPLSANQMYTDVEDKMSIFKAPTKTKLINEATKKQPTQPQYTVKVDGKDVNVKINNEALKQEEKVLISQTKKDDYKPQQKDFTITKIEDESENSIEKQVPIMKSINK